MGYAFDKGLDCTIECWHQIENTTSFCPELFSTGLAPPCIFEFPMFFCLFRVFRLALETD